jgi:hypothetical protein
MPWLRETYITYITYIVMYIRVAYAEICIVYA